MNVNIKAVVEELKKITIENVIYEAITNAIQANATNIQLKIFTHSLIENDKTLCVDRLEIIDNGDGFNDKNLESFNSYRSDYKKHLGCKGVGRFIFLKLFKNIEITSQNKIINFDFNGVKVDKLNNNLKTHISFLNPINSPIINLDNIQEGIKEHFLVYFQMLKNTNKNVAIEILNNNKLLGIIKNEDIQNFEIKEFFIKNYSFKMSYIFGSNLKSEGFYAANNRIVVKNSNLEQDRKLELPKEIKIFFILESKYFDENVNKERNELQIYPKQTNSLDFHNLNWEDIHNELYTEIQDICLENNFDINKKIKENKQNALKEYPYLAGYLKDRNELNVKNMIHFAKKDFNAEKDFIREAKNKNNKDYEVILNKVTQAELAEYIFDRNRVIDKLKEHVRNNSIEKEIHNLFMKQKTADMGQNYKTNNVWLFDDRFMSYDKIFSDKQIKEIFPELAKNLNRPDILCIISNTYDKKKINDILLIEFKRPSNITPDSAETELLKYARYIHDSNLKRTKIRIWAYAFLKFNDDTIELLNDREYNKIYTSNEYPICYKYHKDRNIIINFMDYDSLISDAENRNKLFFDILKGKYLKS